jgi:hypothetical protein
MGPDPVRAYDMNIITKHQSLSFAFALVMLAGMWVYRLGGGPCSHSRRRSVERLVTMRNAFLCASALALVVGRPSAAQEVTPAEAGDSRAPVASLGALSSRVKPSDKIYVRKMSGEEVAGRFLRASDASLTLEIDGQTREIPAGDVQQVSRPGGNRVKQGMLFGFLAGAAVGLAAIAASHSESDFSRGDKMFIGTVAGGGAGLMWGAIIGALVHQRPVVYQAAAPTARLTPVFAPGRASVMFAARF